MSSLLWMGKISRTWCDSGAYPSSIARYGRTNKHRLTHRQLEFGLQFSSASRRTKRNAVSWWHWCLVRQIHWRERAVELAMGTAKNEKGRGRFGIPTGNVQVSLKLQSSCCTCEQGICRTTISSLPYADEGLESHQGCSGELGSSCEAAAPVLRHAPLHRVAVRLLF